MMNHPTIAVLPSKKTTIISRPVNEQEYLALPGLKDSDRLVEEEGSVAAAASTTGRPSVASAFTSNSTTEVTVIASVNAATTRRRAHTLDAEWDGRHGTASLSSSFGHNAAIATGNSNGNGNYREQVGSLESYEESYDDGTVVGGHDNADADYRLLDMNSLELDARDMIEAITDDDDEYQNALPPLTQGDYHWRSTRRCQRVLYKSRVLRGLLVLCIYGSMDLWPTPEPLLLVDTDPSFSLDAFSRSNSAGGGRGVAKNDDNDGRLLSGNTRRRQYASKKKEKKKNKQSQASTVPIHSSIRNNITVAAVPNTVPLDQLPRFRALSRPTFVAGTNKNNKNTKNVYHSTMPPGADPKHWHKIPPSPQDHLHQMNATITAAAAAAHKKIGYHKKSRPILSYAHSYRLRQEALVFGHESNIDFLSDSQDHHRSRHLTKGSGGADDYYFDDLGGYSWQRVLIWMTLVILVADTAYREYQHARFRSRLALSSQSTGSQQESTTTVATTPTTVSPLLRQRRRSSHHRRSLSPTMVIFEQEQLIPRRLRTNRSPRHRGSDISAATTAGAASLTSTPLQRQSTGEEVTSAAVMSSSWRPRRRFDSF